MTTTDSVPTLTESTRERRRSAKGFATIAIAFFATMSFTTIPTPIYGFYQRIDGFPTWVVTVIFAAYAVGVIGALFLIGHISDWAGRRRMILVGIGLEIVAAVIFIVAPSVGGLIVARVVSGVGIGALMAAASAHLVELAAIARPGADAGRATTTSTVANTGGLAVGPMISGVIVTALPAPTLTPYVIYLVLLIVAFVAVCRVPETVERRSEHAPYRPQRLRLPQGARAAFFAAATAAFAGFAVFGVFMALAPSVLTQVMHLPSPLVAGLVGGAALAASALSQLVFARLRPRTQTVLAVALMVTGLTALALGALTASLPLFIAAPVVAGAGVGLVFRAAMATAARVAEPEHRGEVMAAMLLAAYLGLAIPVLAVGVGLLLAPMVAVLVAFAVAVVVLVLVAAAPLLKA